MKRLFPAGLEMWENNKNKVLFPFSRHSFGDGPDNLVCIAALKALGDTTSLWWYRIKMAKVLGLSREQSRCHVGFGLLHLRLVPAMYLCVEAIHKRIKTKANQKYQS